MLGRGAGLGDAGQGCADERQVALRCIPAAWKTGTLMGADSTVYTMSHSQSDSSPKPN